MEKKIEKEKRNRKRKRKKIKNVCARVCDVRCRPAPHTTCAPKQGA
jgi:hypothetical protein